MTDEATQVSRATRKMTSSLMFLLFPLIAFPQQSAKEQQRALNAQVSHYFKNSFKDAERYKFIKLFVTLSPHERVEIWLKDAKRSHMTEGDLKPVMIIHGLDAIPELMQAVRTKKGEDRLLAIHLICDMDRYVPLKDLPPTLSYAFVKDWSCLNKSDASQNGGQLDHFMIVDGRRIGNEASDFVHWATDQTQDQDLRFHAREHSGLLEQDFRKLPVSELMNQWQDAVRRVGPYYSWPWLYTNETVIVHLTEKLLVEKSAAAIPLITKLLLEDKDRSVRTAAFHFLSSIDYFGFRLRTTQDGRLAIRAMYNSLNENLLGAELRTQNGRFYTWRGFVDRAFDDKHVYPHDPSWRTVANAFELFYGEHVTKTITLPLGNEVEGLIPEMVRFVTYMANIDPAFPSWEFSLYGRLHSDMILHPLFKQKIARYYVCWTQFKTAGYPNIKITPDAELSSLRVLTSCRHPL